MKSIQILSFVAVVAMTCLFMLPAEADAGGRSLAVVSGCAHAQQFQQVQVQQYVQPVQVQRVQKVQVVQQHVQPVQVQRVQKVQVVQPVQKVQVQRVQVQHYARPAVQQVIVSGGRERTTERFGLFGRLRFRQTERN